MGHRGGGEGGIEREGGRGYAPICMANRCNELHMQCSPEVPTIDVCVVMVHCVSDMALILINLQSIKP